MNLTAPRRFAQLKARQREIRAGFPESVGLRVHRAISWLQRAEMAHDDIDIAFICYWIAFNAAYSKDVEQASGGNERSAFAEFFDLLIRLDAQWRIYDLIWDTYSGPIRLLLDNRYIYAPFWRHHNGEPGFERWAQMFQRSRTQTQRGLAKKDTALILSTIFDRLYVLRNQLVHGGATWNSRVNREQLRDGGNLLGELVPLFIDLMMDHPEAGWGTPFYPVVENDAGH